MTPKRVSALTGAAILAAMVAGVAEGAALQLEVALDEKVYAEGQRIEVVLCARNRGAKAVQDMVPLSPANIFVELRLSGGPGDKQIARSLEGETWMADKGPTLQPAESDCEHFNLLTFFGSRPQDGSLPGRLSKPMLPVGRYRLEVRLHTREGSSDEALVVAKPVEFEIVPLSRFPSEASLVKGFLSGREWKDRRVGNELDQKEDYCRAWLSRFEGSRFFLLIYVSCGRRMSEVPLEYLLATLESQRADPVRSAAAVSIRSEIDPNVEVREPGWTDNLKRFKRGGAVDDVIDTLRRRVRDRVSK